MTYIETASQVARQVEAKPNIASLLKLRCSSGQLGREKQRAWLRALTLRTCSSLSVRISRRSISVPVHFGSSIVKHGGVNGGTFFG
jgi:hypothetical protein